jgi:hypothetical protein
MTPVWAGRIVAQRSIEGGTGASVFAITARLYAQGAELLASAIEAIAGGATGSPQTGAGSYQSWSWNRWGRRILCAPSIVSTWVMLFVRSL